MKNRLPAATAPLVFALISALALSLVFIAANHYAAQIENNRTAHEARHEQALLNNYAADAAISKRHAIDITLPTAQIAELAIVESTQKPPAVLLKITATDGYNGNIEFLLLQAQANSLPSLPRLRILAHQETPGIADFLASDPEQIYDGKSGATITTSALLSAISESQTWLTTCYHHQQAKLTC